MNRVMIFLSPVGLIIVGILVLGALAGLSLARKAKRRRTDAPGALDLDMDEAEDTGQVPRLAEYPDFPTLLDHFVLPLSQAHPRWQRLDGAYDVPGQPIAWFTWNGTRYSLSGETHIRALIHARDWIREHPGEDPLVVKPTKRGAGRLTLRPEIGWENEKAIRIETG